MPSTLVSSSGAQVTSSSQLTLTAEFGSGSTSVPAGSLIIVSSVWSSLAPSIPTITDSVGSTYTLLQTVPGSGVNLSVFAALSASTSSSLTVTATLPSGSGYMSLATKAFGLPTGTTTVVIDGISTANGTGTAVSSANLSLSSTDIAYAVAIAGNASSAGPGYTLGYNGAGTPGVSYGVTDEYILSATGSVSPSMTLTASSGWTFAALAFRPCTPGVFLNGPTSGLESTQNGPFTVSLSLGLTTSAVTATFGSTGFSGDTFQASLGYVNATAVTIPAGSLSTQFYIRPTATNGTRTIQVTTSPVETILDSLSYVVSGTTYWSDAFSGSSGTTLNAYNPTNWPISNSYCVSNAESYDIDGSGGTYYTRTDSNGGGQIPSWTMPPTPNFVVTFSLVYYSDPLASNNVCVAGVTLFTTTPFGACCNGVPATHIGWSYVKSPSLHGTCFDCDFGNGSTTYSMPGYLLDGSWVPSVGTTYYMKVTVQSAYGNTAMNAYYSTDGVNYTHPSVGGSIVIPTPTANATAPLAVNVGVIGYSGQMTTSTGVHIGDLSVLPLPLPSPTLPIASAMIMPSGGTLAVTLAGTNPLFLNIPPVVSTTNLGSLGTLTGTPWTTVNCPTMLIPLPAGVTIQNGDTVTMTTQSGWVTGANQGGGEAQTNVAVANYGPNLTTGQYYSAWGTDTLTKTYKPGFNVSYCVPNAGTQFLTKNLRYRLAPDGYAASLYNVGPSYQAGYPTTMLSSTIKMDLLDYGGLSNNVDSTQYPTPPGYYCVVWDDAGYLSNPTTLSLVATGAGASVTQDTVCTSVANSGSAGVGIAAMFLVAKTGTSYSAAFSLQWNNTSRSPQVSNVWVCYGGQSSGDPAGDYTWTPGTPLTINRSNPYALANAFTRNLPYGLGVIRWLDSTLGVSQAGYCQFSEPWELRSLTDFAYNNSLYNSTNALPSGAGTGYVQVITASTISAVAVGAGNYLYGDLFLPSAGGSMWTAGATLSGNINATQTSITLSATGDAIFYGVMLQIDSEYMRCVGISGTTVNVVRAQAYGGTQSTAASHTSGATITCGTRVALASLTQFAPTSAQLVSITTTTPHCLKSGMFLNFSNPSAPTSITFTDGNTWGGWTQSPLTVWVTGPTSFIAQKVWGADTVTIGPSTAYPSAPTTYTATGLTVSYNTPANLPYALTAIVCSALLCDNHVSIPPLASDSMVYTIANEILANTTAGRTVWVELSDEPWNQGGQGTTYYQFNLYSFVNGRTSIDPYWWYTQRSGQAGNIFRTVFGSRSSEVKTMLNIQYSGSGATAISYAETYGYAFEAYAVAPYYTADSDQASITYVNSLVPQSGSGNQDFTSLIADYLITSIQSYNGLNIPGTLASHAATISGYNAWLATNFPSLAPIQMYYYEGGYQSGVPGGCASPLGNIAQITPHDIPYTPVWRCYEKEFYAMLQAGAGVGQNATRGNTYTYAYPVDGSAQWYVYAWPGQTYGFGNGKDGKPNNTLCMATPGLTYTKAATTNQDYSNVSVRGQAHVDWMSSFFAGTTSTNQACPAAVMLGL